MTRVVVTVPKLVGYERSGKLHARWQVFKPSSSGACHVDCCPETARCQGLSRRSSCMLSKLQRRNLAALGRQYTQNPRSPGERSAGVPLSLLQVQADHNRGSRMEEEENPGPPPGTAI